MFGICNKIVRGHTMFSRFNDVLQSAADVLAPPPSALHDFQYHWKQVKNFYDQHPSSSTTVGAPFKGHLQDTRIPFHLEQMLQILIREESTAQLPDDDHHDGAVPPVLDFVLTNRPMDVLADLAAVDSPPGATVSILDWVRRFMTCLRNPSLDNESVFQPVQRLVAMCQGGRASPYETQEILFLLTVAGLIRKEPMLIHLFLPSHQHSAFANTHLGVRLAQRTSVHKMPTHNPLFDVDIEKRRPRVSIVAGTEAVDACPEPAVDDVDDDAKSGPDFVCDCAGDEDRLALLDAILGYVESSDTLVILRACEAALILATLSTVSASACPAIQSSLFAFGTLVGDRLAALCQVIPDDMNTGDIEDCTVSWGLVPRDADAQHFVGRAQLCEFLGWLDYANCLARECSPTLTGHMCAYIRHTLLLGVIEPSMVDANAAFMLVLAAKIVHQLDAKHLAEELANWLVGSSQQQMESNDCLLNIIVENAYDNADVFLPTMQFVESLLDNANERILHEMLFRYVNGRGYYDATAAKQIVHTWSDEEDERGGAGDDTTTVSRAYVKSRTLAPTNILKVINHFLLLLPRQIMKTAAGGTCYEEYVQDASVHYQKWIHRTSMFDWPCEASFPPGDDDVTDHPHDARTPGRAVKCNDSGICEESFYEGPLLRLLFHYVQTMATHASELNLAAIAILSKLAFLPHPFLHEILLNPEIPVASGASTLWTSMQSQARQLLLEVPRQEGFQRRVADTAQRLLTPSVMSDLSSDESDPIFESIVVLEEFCKELAAIAFVKYHYATET